MLLHFRQVWRRGTLLGALSVVLAGGLVAAQGAAPEAQTDAQGSVTIKAVYVTQRYFKATPNSPLAGKVDLDRNVVFAITLDTHAGNLGNYDAIKNITLRNAQGQRMTAVKWLAIADSGHHREGALLFPKATGTRQVVAAPGRTLQLVVRNLGGVSQRTLRWTLPVE